MMRNKVEIWIEEERIDNLKTLLMNVTQHKFLDVGGEVINTADITGIFSPETMQDVTRRKNGQWQCESGHWHSRGEECAHGAMARFNKQSPKFDKRRKGFSKI